MAWLPFCIPPWFSQTLPPRVSRDLGRGYVMNKCGGKLRSNGHLRPSSFCIAVIAGSLLTFNPSTSCAHLPDISSTATRSFMVLIVRLHSASYARYGDPNPRGTLLQLGRTASMFRAMSITASGRRWSNPRQKVALRKTTWIFSLLFCLRLSARSPLRHVQVASLPVNFRFPHKRNNVFARCGLTSHGRLPHSRV